MSFSNYFQIILYFVLTILVLIVSFFPEGYIFYIFMTNDNIDLLHYLLLPFYLFMTYCLTVLIFGVIHSQFVVRLTLPFILKPGIYPHSSSMGRKVAVRISADGIFKSMLKVYTFIPFLWGAFLFPKLMKLYGLKIGKNVYITTRTYIETAGLVEIGDNSFIGYNSAVAGHANEGRKIIVSPTKIGKNVMVGTYCIVGPGSTLGDRSILGAKSAIPKGTSVPENEIWVGVPAKFHRKRGEGKGKWKSQLTEEKED